MYPPFIYEKVNIKVNLVECFPLSGAMGGMSAMLCTVIRRIIYISDK